MELAWAPTLFSSIKPQSGPTLSTFFMPNLVTCKVMRPNLKTWCSWGKFLVNKTNLPWINGRDVHYLMGESNPSSNQDLCINFGQFQPTICSTYDRKTTPIWWLANMEYKHSKLWLLCCWFCCCRLMFLSPQVHILCYFWTSGLSIYTWMLVLYWEFESRKTSFRFSS